MPNPLSSPEAYQTWIYSLPANYPAIQRSTLAYIPPNIKQNRIPAPDLSFTKPNLPFLIEEIESLLAEETGNS